MPALRNYSRRIYVSWSPLLLKAYITRITFLHIVVTLIKRISTLVILIGTYILSLIFDSILAHTFGRSLKDNSLAKKYFHSLRKSFHFYLVGFTRIYPFNFWINISALVTGAGVGGVLFALASKEAISNLFGSLSLIFSHNFKIGDTISRVKGLEGVVEEISISYTRLVDKKGSAIFMPNKLIVSETIENLSMAPSKKAEFAFDTGVQLDTKTAKNLEWLENDIEKLEKTHGPLHTKVSIEGLREKWLNILVKIDSESENMAKN